WTSNKNKKIIKSPEKLFKERKQPELLKGSEFNLIKKLQEQKLEITLSQLLKISFQERKKLKEVLRTPKETVAKLASQNNNTKTTTLECEVMVNGFKVPATINSEVATSIISESTMEQLQYDIEEATNCKIILANREKNESLGRIRDFPIEIEGKTIPINVEELEIRELLSNRYIVKPEEFKVGELKPEQKEDFNKLIKQYEEIF
ncbi:4770_t:CDS:2, partial [Dentiscutata erythropus]